MQHDPKLSLFQSTCVRKHLILNKIYYLFVFQDALILSEVKEK